jgi:hypothetical protein
MSSWYDPSLVAAAHYFAIGGVALGVALVAVERYAPRWSARLTFLAAALLGCGSILSAALASWELAVAAALLGAASLLMCAVRTSTFQVGLQWATCPLAVASMLLLLSLSAVAYIQIASAPCANDTTFPGMVGTSFHCVDGVVGLTDLGRQLPLIAYDDSAQVLREKERAVLGSEQFAHQIIRLAEPNAGCNCHGWIYTGGRSAIQSRFVPDLLKDNGYQDVSDPRAGDLVIYRHEGSAVEHTGLVRMVDATGLVLVESKWGPLGVYLHPVDAQPYCKDHKFYRSRRAGHVVSIVPKSSAPENELPALAQLSVGGIDDLEPALAARRGRPMQSPILERPILRVPGQRRS